MLTMGLLSAVRNLLILESAIILAKTSIHYTKNFIPAN
jgi:hypothetical protein